MNKSCENCSGKFRGCMLENNIITSDMEIKAECLLEEGIFEEILREQIDLTDLFEHMQEQGIIKKNIKVN